MNPLLKYPPLFYIGLFLSSGIILSSLIPVKLLIIFTIPIIIILLFGMRNSFIILICISFLSGIFLYLSNQHALQNIKFVEAFKNEQIIISGRVLEVKNNNNKQKILIKPNRPTEKGELSIYGNLYLFNDKLNRKIEVNNFICFEGQLIEYDLLDSGFQDFLQKKNCGLVVRANKIKRINPSNNFLFWTSIQKTRQFTIKSIQKYLSGQSQAFAQAILTGNRQDLNEQTKTDFQTSGLMHILAISGLHVAILVSLLYMLFNFLAFKLFLKTFIVTTFLLFFIFFSGASPSVIRASLMSIFVIIYIQLGRGIDFLAPLSLAALIMLMQDPNQIFQTSFQLSYGAVLSLGIIYPYLDELIISSYCRIKRILLATTSVQIGLLPLLFSYFHSFSIAAFWANLFVLPLLPIVLTLLIISIISQFISGFLSPVLFRITGLVLQIILNFSKFSATIPGAEINMLSFPFWLAIIFYFLILATIKVLLMKNKRFNLAAFIFVLIIILTVNIWLGLAKAKSPIYLEVVFFDVGQGDSILVRSPEGYTVLLDGGESEYLLENNLNKEVISRIDLLIITHPHQDHVGGLRRIINEYKIGKIILSNTKSDLVEYVQLIKEAKNRKIPVAEGQIGDQYRLGKLVLELLHPPPEKIKATDSPENDNSLVVLFDYDDFNLLLTGDIEEEGVEYLLKEDFNLEADVLKVPHHGSAYGLNDDLLSKIRPKLAVISVGKDNDFGHPSPKVLGLLNSYNCTVYRTDSCGNVKIASDGQEFWVTNKE